MERLSDTADLSGPPDGDTTNDGAGDGKGSASMRPAPIIAALSMGAAIIHFAMAPAHALDSTLEPVGFAIAGWAQALVAVALVLKPRKATFAAAAVVNIVILGLWAWSRTTGLPVGAHPWEPESSNLVDLGAALMAGGAVLGSVVRLSAPELKVKIPAVVPALGALAIIALSTAVVTSEEAAEHAAHQHPEGEEHAHGDEAMLAQLQLIQDTRCDLAFNTKAYYQETEYIGIDIISAPGMSDHGAHDHGLDVVRTDPLQGRGDPELDKLVAKINTESEAEAGILVSELGDVDEEMYEAFLYQMNVHHSGHSAHDASGDDHGGHGGHVGPQPWVAMTDAEECATLQEELDRARETAMKYPTAKDAEEAGYRMVTPYVPGIAAHWMHFGYVDGVFELEKPEMLLYDGNGLDAHIVGLSYYIMHRSDTQPTQGFTGQNDHYHRHIGLCMRGGLVIGDTQLSEEECAALGGRKSGGGGAGWMSHAWVVPGCESPWGLFSGTNPLLDGALGRASGQNPGCADSGVNHRYDLTPGSRADVRAPLDDLQPNEQAAG